MKVQSIIFASLAIICIAFEAPTSLDYHLQTFPIQGNVLVDIDFDVPIISGYLHVENSDCTVIGTEKYIEESEETEKSEHDLAIPMSGVSISGGITFLRIDCLKRENGIGLLRFFDKEIQTVDVLTVRKVTMDYHEVIQQPEVIRNVYHFDNPFFIEVSFDDYLISGQFMIENMNCEVREAHSFNKKLQRGQKIEEMEFTQIGSAQIFQLTCQLISNHDSNQQDRKPGFLYIDIPRFTSRVITVLDIQEVLPISEEDIAIRTPLANKENRLHL